MSPTLVRIAFVFNIDKDNSFDNRFISTRAKRHAIEEKYKSEISISDLELYYVLACKEAEDLPVIFTDREYYMKLWYEGSEELPHIDDAKIKTLQDLMEAKGALIAEYLRKEESEVHCDLVQEDVGSLGLDAGAVQEMDNNGSDEDLEEEDDYPIVELRKHNEALPEVLGHHAPSHIEAPIAAPASKMPTLADFIAKVDAEANNDVQRNSTKRDALFVDNDGDIELCDAEPRTKRPRTFDGWRAEEQSKMEVDGAILEGTIGRALQEVENNATKASIWIKKKKAARHRNQNRLDTLRRY